MFNVCNCFLTLGSFPSLRMPFIPAVVNVLLYFAGYTPSQRNDLFGALSQEAQQKLIENDVELATYALPLDQCPMEHETMSFIASRIGNECCNPLFHGLCSRNCYADIPSHQGFVRATGVGVRALSENCKSGIGLGEDLMLMHLESMPKLSRLIWEAAGSSTPDRVDKRNCVARVTRNIPGLFRSFIISTSSRYNAYRTGNRYWQTMDMSPKNEFIRNIMEETLPGVMQCWVWDDRSGRWPAETLHFDHVTLTRGSGRNHLIVTVHPDRKRGQKAVIVSEDEQYIDEMLNKY